MDKPTILTIKDYSDIQDAHKRGECTVRIFNWDRVMSKKQWLIVNKISGFDGTEAWVETNHRDFYEAYDQVLDVQWIADDLATPAATPPTGAPAAGEGDFPDMRSWEFDAAMISAYLMGKHEPRSNPIWGNLQSMEEALRELQADNARLADELARARALLVYVHRNAPQQEPEQYAVRLYPIAHSYWQAGKLIHAFLSGEGK